MERVFALADCIVASERVRGRRDGVTGLDDGGEVEKGLERYRHRERERGREWREKENRQSGGRKRQRQRQRARQDPLGLLEVANELRYKGLIALEVLGSLGVLGGLALWVTRHYLHGQGGEWERFWYGAR
jgi:hypothetical protein